MFRPGDEVVVLDPSKIDDPLHDFREQTHGKIITVGNVYTVEVVIMVGGEEGLILKGHPSPHPSRSWASIFFRKVAKKGQFAHIVESLKLLGEKELISG